MADAAAVAVAAANPLQAQRPAKPVLKPREAAEQHPVPRSSPLSPPAAVASAAVVVAATAAVVAAAATRTTGH